MTVVAMYHQLIQEQTESIVPCTVLAMYVGNRVTKASSGIVTFKSKPLCLSSKVSTGEIATPETQMDCTTYISTSRLDTIPQASRLTHYPLVATVEAIWSY